MRPRCRILYTRLQVHGAAPYGQASWACGVACCVAQVRPSPASHQSRAQYVPGYYGARVLQCVRRYVHRIPHGRTGVTRRRMPHGPPRYERRDEAR